MLLFQIMEKTETGSADGSWRFERVECLKRWRFLPPKVDQESVDLSVEMVCDSIEIPTGVSFIIFHTTLL